MDYYKKEELAKRLDKSVFTVEKYIANGVLPGRKIGGTWITTKRELEQYLDGKLVDKIRLAKVYTVPDAAKYLNVGVYTIRKMLRNGQLKGQRIDKRGRGGTTIMTTRALNNAKKYVPKYLDYNPKGGRPTKDNIDKHIENINGLYQVVGTHNINWEPYTYKTMERARKRARKAYGSPMAFCNGDLVRLLTPEAEPGNRCPEAWLLHDVTAECKTAKVRTKETDGCPSFEIIIKVSEILSKITYEHPTKK
jgi:excisionase family DNA binding protein